MEAVGVPHLLEIEYPASTDQHFSLSIVEPNAAGIVEGIGRDGGVYVEGFGREVEKQTHRMVFWPRTQSPMLLVTNQHPGAAAMFGTHSRAQTLLATASHGTRLVAVPPIVWSPRTSLVRCLPNRLRATGGVARSAGLVCRKRIAFDDWQTLYEMHDAALRKRSPWRL